MAAVPRAVLPLEVLYQGDHREEVREDQLGEDLPADRPVVDHLSEGLPAGPQVQS